MNWLIEPLPDKVCNTPVYTDFRHMMRIDALFRDSEVDDKERIALALDLFYKDILPEEVSLEEAVKGLLFFYAGGEEKEEDRERGPGGKQACDFEQDFRYIYAAFQQSYNIDLESASLHWWKFLALFAALPEDTGMTKIMGYRMADASKASKEQRPHILKMQKQYRLKKPGKKDSLKKTIEEVEADYQREAHERYERAKSKLKGE